MCTLPKFGIEKEVRVCEACYMTLHAPTTITARNNNDTDLPAEYLTSSLAQQSQVNKKFEAHTRFLLSRFTAAFCFVVFLCRRHRVKVNKN